jgi:hypothetical protein
VPGITISRRDGKLSIKAEGCCGVGGTKAFYDRAHAVQVLREGGRLTGWDAVGFEITDRRGRVHTYAL